MSKTETQSEALRIAEEFEACGILDAIPSINEICQAALELRRLDAENKALRERLEADPAACTATGGLSHEQALAATRAVREVLEKEHSVYLTNASILRIVQAVEGAAQAAAKNGGAA